MESFRAAVASGALAIETDAFVLGDGAIGVMRDDTVDRTTSATGSVYDHSAPSWGGLQIDHSVGGTWVGRTLRPPLLAEVLDELGGKVCFVIEGKHEGAVTALREFLYARYPHLKPSIVLTQFVNYVGTDELAAAVADGWHTAAYTDAVNTLQPPLLPPVSPRWR